MIVDHKSREEEDSLEDPGSVELKMPALAPAVSAPATTTAATTTNSGNATMWRSPAHSLCAEESFFEAPLETDDRHVTFNLEATVEYDNTLYDDDDLYQSCWYTEAEIESWDSSHAWMVRSLQMNDPAIEACVGSFQEFRVGVLTPFEIIVVVCHHAANPERILSGEQRTEWAQLYHNFPERLGLERAAMTRIRKDKNARRQSLLAALEKFRLPASNQSSVCPTEVMRSLAERTSLPSRVFATELAKALRISCEWDLLQDEDLTFLQRWKSSLSTLPSSLVSLPGNLATASLASLQELPKNIKELPRNIKELPKNLPPLPKNIKELPRNLKELPKNLPPVPKTIKELPKNIKELPKNLPPVPKTIKELPKNIKELPKNLTPHLPKLPNPRQSFAHGRQSLTRSSRRGLEMFRKSMSFRGVSRTASMPARTMADDAAAVRAALQQQPVAPRRPVARNEALHQSCGALLEEDDDFSSSYGGSSEF